MKFPKYSGGAQGDLLVAHAIDADDLRPYAEVRHHDQIVSKQGMHLYVEREPSEEPAPVSDAVGGVLRAVGHTLDGYTSFKANDEDEYRPTTELYAVDGQTNPATTWPTFWRRGLSGPAAMWAQFARGFAQAYTDYIERESIAWGGSPDIGDAVIVVPRTGLAPQVFCIRGYLGAEPVQYLQVQVVPESAFAGAPVPEAILDLFGGVPFPLQAADWASAPAIAALAPDAIRTAVGVTGSAWEWRTGFQIEAVGPYAVEQNRADTVVVLQHSASLESVSTHLRIEFTASLSAALAASVVREGESNCPVFAEVGIYGVLEEAGLEYGAIQVGGTGPGWTEPGLAVCPMLVMFMDGQFTKVSYLRTYFIKPSGFADNATGYRVTGAVEAEIWGSQGETFTPGKLSMLNFWGEEGGFYVISATDNVGPQLPDAPVVYTFYDDVELYVDGQTFTLDLNAVYPHFGQFPPKTDGLVGPISLIRLTDLLPRVDAGQPVFIDVARSTVGGEQIVGRIAGLQDPDYNLPGALAGTLVEMIEDQQFPNGPYVTFVGELQE